MALAIDIGVGGRFHADRLAVALLALGHEVDLWTSLPRSRFGPIPSERVRSFLWPEIVYRLARKVGQENAGDIYKSRRFGRSMAQAQQHRGGRRDLFMGWSSFSLEVLSARSHAHTALFRDSTHIEWQTKILQQESERLGVRFADRTPVVRREIAEYALADTIFVLSEFAKSTFLEAGVNPSKLHVLPLGVDTARFVPTPKAPARLPLKLVYFGTVGVRKGVVHLLEAVSRFSPGQVELTVIGPVEPILQKHLCRYDGVRWVGPLEQPALAARLGQFDVFVLPTLEDGFGQTLIQAMACGLVPITTQRCGAAEVITSGVNGFVIEAGSADALEESLERLVRSPSLVWDMRERVLAGTPAMGWDRYEKALGEWIQTGLGR